MLTRFAPSPTGYLHTGNIRTALICYLYARKVGGKFMLRIDDTDLERSEEKFVDAIKEDLAWLGIEFDLTEKQSNRFARYDAEMKKLIDGGRVYPCYESAAELDFKRKMQLGQGKPPVYDRSALKLTAEDKAKLEAEGRKPHYRFKLEEREISWEDEIRGTIKMSAATMSDPIIIRENGAYTYMFPSTVDDIDFKVTNVLRGEDHISNTAIQIQMFEALGAKPPMFAHNSLIKTKEGKLSKREGKGAVAELRENGMQPMALCSFLAKIGTSDSVELKHNMQELIDEFDIKKFSKSPTMYSSADIDRLNTKAVHEISFEEVKGKLPEGVNEEFWNAVRNNVEHIEEAGLWWKIVKGDFENKVANDDKEFLKLCAEKFPSGEVTEETWNVWLNEVKPNTDRKGKTLFMPIRIALTGIEHGPEIKTLLPLISREEILKRLIG